MAITIVQSTQSTDLSNNATLGAGLTLNNYLLLVAASYFSSGSTSPAVTYFVGANSYTTPSPFLTRGSTSGSGDVVYTAWLVPIISAMAGQTGLSFTATGTGAIKLYGIELSVPSGDSIVVDQSVSNSGNATSTFNSLSITPVHNGELAVFAIPVYVDTVASGQVPNPPWNLIGDTSYMQVWYQNGVGTSAISLTGSLTGTTQYSSGLFSLYDLPAGTNVSVSDYAGAVESASVTATALFSEVAGAVDSASTLMFISVADLAGAVELSGISVSASINDLAGAVDFESINRGTAPVATFAIISVNAYTQLNSSFASSCTAGAPIQGNMRQLALDRWNYMYPS
jgi:hypothetical protein